MHRHAAQVKEIHVRQVVVNTTVPRRWCDQLSDWLDSLSWYLMRRRLQAEASEAWQGNPECKLDYTRLGPVITVLLKLAQPALYHKNGGLRSASLEVLSNAVYLQPDLVLPVVVKRFQEALAASNSVHQISSSIRAFSGMPTHSLLAYSLILPQPHAEVTAWPIRKPLFPALMLLTSFVSVGLVCGVCRGVRTRPCMYSLTCVPDSHAEDLTCFDAS